MTPAGYCPTCNTSYTHRLTHDAQHDTCHHCQRPFRDHHGADHDYLSGGH